MASQRDSRAAVEEEALRNSKGIFVGGIVPPESRVLMTDFFVSETGLAAFLLIFGL